METAAQSGDPEIAEELLRFYVEQKERECFAAALFTCYDLIRPDVALEVSWSVLAGVASSKISRCSLQSCAADPISMGRSSRLLRRQSSSDVHSMCSTPLII